MRLLNKLVIHLRKMELKKFYTDELVVEKTVLSESDNSQEHNNIKIERGFLDKISLISGIMELMGKKNTGFTDEEKTDLATIVADGDTELEDKLIQEGEELNQWIEEAKKLPIVGYAKEGQHFTNVKNAYNYFKERCWLSNQNKHVGELEANGKKVTIGEKTYYEMSHPGRFEKTHADTYIANLGKSIHHRSEPLVMISFTGTEGGTSKNEIEMNNTLNAAINKAGMRNKIEFYQWPLYDGAIFGFGTMRFGFGPWKGKTFKEFNNLDNDSPLVKKDDYLLKHAINIPHGKPENAQALVAAIIQRKCADVSFCKSAKDRAGFVRLQNMAMEITIDKCNKKIPSMGLNEDQILGALLPPKPPPEDSGLSEDQQDTIRGIHINSLIEVQRSRINDIIAGKNAPGAEGMMNSVSLLSKWEKDLCEKSVKGQMLLAVWDCNHAIANLNKGPLPTSKYGDEAEKIYKKLKKEISPKTMWDNVIVKKINAIKNKIKVNGENSSVLSENVTSMINQLVSLNDDQNLLLARAIALEDGQKRFDKSYNKVNGIYESLMSNSEVPGGVSSNVFSSGSNEASRNNTQGADKAEQVEEKGQRQGNEGQHHRRVEIVEITSDHTSCTSLGTEVTKVRTAAEEAKARAEAGAGAEAGAEAKAKAEAKAEAKAGAEVKKDNGPGM